MTRSIIRGCGSYLPARVVTNNDLANTVDTSDEWITERTGIKRRHIASKDEQTSDLAVCAAKDALANAKLTAADIDAVIVATTTPDRTFPSTAATVQAKLGIAQGFAFDIQAVCAGFVFALSVADSLLKSKQASRILVIGAETMSRIVDWNDRKTCVLFGDGAGALILEADHNETQRGILSTHLHTDGRFEELLYVSGGPGNANSPTGTVQMQGQEVFKHATQKMAACVQEGLEANGLTLADIDWLIPHQANARILQSVAKKLKLTDDKVIMTVENHANTSGASIPLAIAHANREGKLNKGDLIVLEAIGGGLSWGSAFIRW